MTKEKGAAEKVRLAAQALNEAIAEAHVLGVQTIVYVQTVNQIMHSTVELTVVTAQCSVRL